MLDKLSSRERVLAMVAMGLVPLTLVFALFMWISGQLASKDAELNNLQQRFADARQKQLQAMQAGKRKAIYVQESLPSNINDAKVQYWNWLSNLAQDKVGVDDFSLRQLGRDLQRTYAGRDPVFTQMTFSLNFNATLEQLTRFLYEFYNAKMLHRIVSVSVNPNEVLVPGSSTSALRLNTLKVLMTIEVASLKEADSSREFEEETRNRFTRSVDEIQKSIVFRNIFGLPNNAPEFTAIGTKSAEVGDSVSFNIRANDNDEGDKLTFELVSTEASGAMITHSDSGERFVKFECPPLDEGVYDFTLRVTDNGCPPKSALTDFTLRVSRPAPVVKRDPEPAFRHAGQAYVTAFVSDRTGQPQVWINVRTTGDWYKVSAGESFELDGHQWTIVKIDAPLVIIQRDDEQFTFEKGSNLESPIKKISSAQTTASSRTGGTN